jgi:hypothetical protein
MAQRGNVRWRQREATRVIKALAAAGQEVDRFEFGPDGKMAVFPRRRGEQAPAPSETDDIVARLK